MAQRKELRALCKERSVLEISFDELKYDRDQARGKISRFVGLRDADWSGPEYTRNTSFETDRDRMSVIGVGDLIVIRTVQLLFAILPQQTVRGLRRRFSRATTDVIPGTYRHIEHDALI